MGRFLTKDTWTGDTNNPLSLNRWAYGYGNPIRYADPSGNVPFNRNIAANYAREYASKYNYTKYGVFGSNDCTAFVSQALKEGGFPEDTQWFFKQRSSSVITTKRCSSIGASAYESHCGDAWALTLNLYRYLTQTKGFSSTIVGQHGQDIPGSGNPFPLPANTKKGDVVFFRQEGTPYIDRGLLFNHAAIIVDASGPVTSGGEVAKDPFTGKPIPGTAPQIADHSGAYHGVRAINDTRLPVQMLLIVHIPDNVPTSSMSSLQIDCIPEMVQPYLGFLFR